MECPSPRSFVTLLPPRYRIERVLSEGEHAATVHAFDAGLRQAPAVIKIQALGGAGATDIDEGFRRFCGTLATIQDDRLAVPYTFGTLAAEDGGAVGYAVRGYVNGTPLSAFALPMAADAALLATLQVCHGLDVLHDLGLFHGDLKPENVIVRHAPGGRIDEHSQCVLIDIAYRPQTGAESLTEMTLQYIAPELLEGKPPGPRTDLYAVGVMAYRLLSGRLPFDGGSLPEMIRRQRSREFPRLVSLRPDLSRGICDSVERLLEPNPENRPVNVQALIALLQEQGGSSAGPATRPAMRSRRFVGRESELAACMAALDLGRSFGGVGSIEVSGAPGCGVTAFLRELQDRLEAQGVTVLTATPREVAGAPVQSQLHAAVHALVRRPHVSGDAGRVRAPTTSTDLLDDLLVATEDRRVVLFVDDWRLGDVAESVFLQRLILQDRATSDVVGGRSGRCQVILGSTSSRTENAVGAVAGVIAKRVRLEGLSREEVAELVSGDDAVPLSFAARLHAATAGSPRAIRAFLERLPPGRTLASNDLDALLDVAQRETADGSKEEVRALLESPGGRALLALALWADDLDVDRWQAISVALGRSYRPDDPEVERVAGARVRSRHRYLSEVASRQLAEADLQLIAGAVVDATSSAWRSNEPAELIQLLRFAGRVGRWLPSLKWRICRALIVLLERGLFADVETLAVALSELPRAHWSVALFGEAARTAARTAQDAASPDSATRVTDAREFFRSWIRARRLLRARYRKEALKIIDTLATAPLGVVPIVALALAEDRALAAAETGDSAGLVKTMQWMLARARLLGPMLRRRSGNAIGAASRLRLRACRQRARYQRVRARAHLLMGRVGRALTACRKERVLDRAQGNTLREASCLNNEGVLLTRVNAGAASAMALERCVRLRERLDDEGGLAITLINLAAALSMTGNLGGAASVLNRARIVATRNGLGRVRNLTLLNLAVAYNRRGQLRDARRTLRQARHTTRDESDVEALAHALSNSGSLAIDRWSPLAAERCALELDRVRDDTCRDPETSGDLVRAELAYRTRDWARLHTVVGRMSKQGVPPSLTAVYEARVAAEAGDPVGRDRQIAQGISASARLRLMLMRRRRGQTRLNSLSRVIRFARNQASAREAVEWIVAHLAGKGADEASLDLGLKALSWFEFREGHDDLQIELRAALAAMLRTRGRHAEAWRLIEDALLRFRRLERRLRRWPRGAHVLLHLQEKMEVALRGAAVSGRGSVQEMSAALCVQAFDLLTENRKRAVGGDAPYADALVRLGSALGRRANVDTLIDDVLAVALGLTGAQRAILITGTVKSHEVRRTVLATGGATAGVRLDMSWAVVSQVLASGEASIFSDALTSEELASHRSIATFKLRSLACVPLRVGGEVLGVLYLDHHGIAGLITSDMLGFLELLAALLAMAIHRNQSEERAARARAELAETHRHLMRAERNRVAGELAGGLVHDLKNVLAAVSGRAQLLRRVNGDANVLRTLDAIEKAAGTGVGLLQRLQECARDHSSQREETVDIVAVALEALELLGPRLEKGRVQVDVKAAGGALAWGTPGEYRELFLNLLVNACDAMPEGGTLTISVAANVETGQIEIAVRDTGAGMSDETKARIFEPFFTTKGNHGTGLGLVVVRSVVVRRGGTVAVESALGAGTCFRVTVPAVAARPKNEEGHLVSKRPPENSSL